MLISEIAPRTDNTKSSRAGNRICAGRDGNLEIATRISINHMMARPVSMATEIKRHVVHICIQAQSLAINFIFLEWCNVSIS